MILGTLCWLTTTSFLIAIGLDCTAIGSCLRDECQCEKSTEALERLVQIYNTEAIIGDMVCLSGLQSHHVLSQVVLTSARLMFLD
jgi:hypothetical protein